MKLRYALVFASVLLMAHCASAQVFDMVVAQDGSGDYTSLQAALDRMRVTGERTLIYIKSGTYEEKVNVTHSNISLIGEDVSDVVITWDDYSGDAEGHSTSSSYTLQVEGDGFYAENITFANSAGDVGQAVAVSTTGSQQIFNNCRMLGFQDTYYARKGMQYLKDCYIEGATDFIFGESTAVFDHCEVMCVEGGQYITAPADTKLITEVGGGPFYHGLLFLDSEISSGEGVGNNSYYLGRPWQPNASTVYVRCTYGSHIRDLGWSTWSGDNHLTGFFAEYNNVNEAGELVDVSGRVDWSTQLTEQQVNDYYNLDYFFNGWDPLPVAQAPDSPEGLMQNTENEAVYELSWEPVADAIGYVVAKNDATYGFSETSSITDTDSGPDDWYKVRSVSATGALSSYSGQAPGASVGATVLSATETNGFWIKQRILESTERMNVKIYTISGRLMLKRSNTREVDLNGLQRGIYLIKIETVDGSVITKKIAI